MHSSTRCVFMADLLDCWRPLSTTCRPLDRGPCRCRSPPMLVVPATPLDACNSSHRTQHISTPRTHAMTATALITGASGGIGLAIAERLAGDGFEPILVARSPQRLDQAVNQLGARFNGRLAEAHVCDVSDPKSVAALFERLAAKGTQLQLLVNGAGISGGGITAQVSDQLWQDVINTNLNGMFYVTRDA